MLWVFKKTASAHVSPEISAQMKREACESFRNDTGIAILEIKKRESGEPYPVGFEGFVSVSHSGNLFVCAFSDSPAGIDVEQLFQKPDLRENKNEAAKYAARLLKISRRFFSHDENIALGEAYEAGDAVLFIKSFKRVWTVKEALCKIDGGGMKDIKKCDSANIPQDISVIPLEDLPDDYVGHVCIRKNFEDDKKQ